MLLGKTFLRLFFPAMCHQRDIKKDGGPGSFACGRESVLGTDILHF